MRKILIVAVALIAIGIIAIGAVSAEEWSFNFGQETNSDGGSININNNELKIQDEKFTIPEGFKEIEKSRILGKDSPEIQGGKVSGVLLKNGDKNITVKVIYGKDLGINLTANPDDGGENKTIGGHNGVLVASDNNVEFTYKISGDKLVQIDAPAESDVEALLK